MRFAALCGGAVEIALLVFLLYSIRLMAEFTSTSGRENSFSLALNKHLHSNHFYNIVAAITALSGCAVLEYLRKERQGSKPIPWSGISCRRSRTAGLGLSACSAIFQATW